MCMNAVLNTVLGPRAVTGASLKLSTLNLEGRIVDVSGAADVRVRRGKPVLDLREHDPDPHADPYTEVEL